MRKSLTLGLIEAKDAYREILTGAIEGLPEGASLGGRRGMLGASIGCPSELRVRNCNSDRSPGFPRAGGLGRCGRILE